MSNVRTLILHRDCGAGGIHCPCCNTDRFCRGTCGRRARARNRSITRGNIRTRLRDFDRLDLNHDPH